LGIAKDVFRGAKYLKRSAETGNAVGENNFSYCLEDGIGIKKDTRRAMEKHAN
jgi:TPR repeat protein